MLFVCLSFNKYVECFGFCYMRVCVCSLCLCFVVLVVLCIHRVLCLFKCYLLLSLCCRLFVNFVFLLVVCAFSYLYIYILFMIAFFVCYGLLFGNWFAFVLLRWSLFVS